MARKKADPAVVDALLSALRDGSDAAEALNPALSFLSGDSGVDALDPDLALAAVAAAVALGRPAPVAAASEARDKRVRKAARAAAHRLRSAGVDVQAAAHRPTTWQIAPEARIAAPPVALLGLPEDDGYVPFLLASFGDEQACVSAGVAGPGRGFRDEDHAHTSRSQARKILDGARGDHRLFPVPFHDAVALLEQAFDAVGRRPDGWEHLLSHLDEGVRNAARVLDPLRELPRELDIDALHRPEPLLDGRWVILAQHSPEESEGFLREVIGVLDGELYPDEASRRARVEEIVDTAADALFAGPGRESWAWAHDVVAFLARKSDDLEASAVARATALALREGRAGRDVPWARESVNRQLSVFADIAVRGMRDRPGSE